MKNLHLLHIPKVPKLPIQGTLSQKFFTSSSFIASFAPLPSTPSTSQRSSARKSCERRQKAFPALSCGVAVGRAPSNPQWTSKCKNHNSLRQTNLRPPYYPRNMKKRLPSSILFWRYQRKPSAGSPSRQLTFGSNRCSWERPVLFGVLPGTWQRDGARQTTRDWVA